jgi:hypothetical protein
MHDAATGEVFGFAQPKVSTGKLKPVGNSDVSYEQPMTKAEEAEMREATHALMLGVTMLIKKEAAVPNGNGKTQRNTIIAALLIAFTPLAFNVVWWTRGTERDTSQAVSTLLEDNKRINNELTYLKTWNEKLRNNMAAYGWLVDTEGNVTRLDDSKKRR